MTINVSPTKPNAMLPSTVDMVVDWLKSDASLQAIIDPGSRISSTLPKDEDSIVYPWLTVSRVVGLPVLHEAGIDRARVTFNAWGGITSSGAPYWPESDLLIRTVEHVLRNVHSVHIVGKGHIVDVSGLEGIQQLTDPDTGGARWWMDSIIVTRGE